MRHTAEELRQWQALPLNVKVRMTQQRIRDWVHEFGIDGVYVSFSGGKDSTVLLTIARQLYPDIKAAFVDTGLEYPEVREFVRTWDDVEWLKPKKTFKQVINDYGYPFISKEVSERIYYAQRYLTWYKTQKQALTDRQTDRQTAPSPYGLLELAGVSRGSEEAKEMQKTREVPEEILMRFATSEAKGNYKIKELFGMLEKPAGGKTAFDYRKWRWLAECPYMISSKCCDVMKKSPARSYQKQTGRKPITGQMACESKLRILQWMKNGCNAFDAKKQVSNPMSFWTEQDALTYIKKNNVKIASVYGDIIEDDPNGVEGQMWLSDWEPFKNFDLAEPPLKTTGCRRTGCMFCGFGCHLEKDGEGRFERMKATHPKQYDYIMRPAEEGGLDFKNVIDWLNENGGLHIRY